MSRFGFTSAHGPRCRARQETSAMTAVAIRFQVT